MGRRIALAVIVVALGASGSASAGPPGQWTRVTDAGGRNIDQIGLARSADGVLNIVWTRQERSGVSLVSGRISPVGQTIPGELVVQAGWRTISGPDLLALPSGLLAVWGGVPPGSAVGEAYAATLAPGAAAWAFAGQVTPDGGAAYASDQIDAALGHDGTPLLAWSVSFSLRTHLGLDPAVASRTWQTACCTYRPAVGVDGVTGEAVLAWSSNATNEYGLWTQSIAPTPGERRYLPGSGNEQRTAAVAPDQKLGITGRIAAPGVFMAFGAGYPTWSSVWVWEHGSARATQVWKGVVRDPTIAAGPSGRLWLAWHSQGNQIYAVRSNRDATRWGAVVRLSPPPRANTLWKLAGDGSRGPLDLLVSASTPGSLAYWHQQVLPALSVACAGGRVVRCTVADAGEAVRGAAVRMGSRTLKTNRRGQVALDLPRGSYIVRVTKRGYAAATARVRAI